MGRSVTPKLHGQNLSLGPKAKWHSLLRSLRGLGLLLLLDESSSADLAPTKNDYVLHRPSVQPQGDSQPTSKGRRRLILCFTSTLCQICQVSAVSFLKRPGVPALKGEPPVGATANDAKATGSTLCFQVQFFLASLQAIFLVFYHGK